MIFACVPFIKSLGIPDYILEENKRTLPLPLVVSVKGLKPGYSQRFLWHGIPVGVYRRTQEEIEQFSRMSFFINDPLSSEQELSPYWLKNSTWFKRQLVPNEKWLNNPHRSLKKEYFVYSSVSPLYSCVVKLMSNKYMTRTQFPSRKPKGFYDPCANAIFDLAGRIYINEKFKQHMFIPNHRFLDENTIEFLPNEVAFE